MANRFKSAGSSRPTLGRVDETNTKSQMEAKRLRSSYRWQKCRNRFIKLNPLCCNPFNDHHEAVPAKQVHHIEPVAEAPELLCVTSNLASLCDDCHGKVEGMERAGKPTKKLFKIDANKI